MLGIVIVTHGSLCEGLKSATEVIVGQTNIETVSLFENDQVMELREKIKNSINKVNKGEGVIVFTDILGATPYNESLLTINELREEYKKEIYVVSGVNLPMILETINHRFLKTPINKALEFILNSASEGIKCWNFKLKKEDYNEF